VFLCLACLYWHCKLENKPHDHKLRMKNDQYKNTLARNNGFNLIRITEKEENKLIKKLEFLNG